MDQQSFIYKFLLAPQFRIWRYLALTVFFSIVSLNQALVGYINYIPAMGNNIYWIIIATILSYIITVYIISKKTFKYLLSGKYVLFVFYIIICALFFTAIPNIVEAYYKDDYDFFSTYIIIDNLSAFIIYILCISGVIIPVFLRNWIISQQHLSQLKKKQEVSEVEQLKEQINPSSFFKTLRKSSSLVKEKPAKASEMLMKLSQLLRYQLYDCNRTQVLLTAEVSFLRNFLELEKLYSCNFNYSLNVTGEINTIFIPPSVLLPYVQCVLNTFETIESQTIDIHILIQDKSILFKIKASNIQNNLLLKKELLNTRTRLEALYSNRYTLTVNKLKNNDTEINLELEKD